MLKVTALTIPKQGTKDFGEIIHSPLGTGT